MLQQTYIPIVDNSEHSEQTGEKTRTGAKIHQESQVSSDLGSDVTQQYSDTDTFEGRLPAFLGHS